jgi:hypothetical protein
MLPLAFANILILVVASVLGSPESLPPPEAPQQPSAPVHSDPEVDRMLTELETADRGMRDLTARITYDRIDATLGDRQYRFGELLFRDRTPEGQENRAGTRSFVVRFRKYADLDVVRDLNESWAFDGRWLIERNDDDKTFRKREITRAGQEVDPLRLGEGPLPIPIGQRKQDILARYEVELVDPTDSLEATQDPTDEDAYASYRDTVLEAQRKTDAVQLKLTPLRKEDGDFDSIRLWYWKSPDNADRWLPLMARAAKVNARGREVDIAFVLMSGVKVNQGITDEQMLVPEPSSGEGYTTQIDRLPVEEGQ